MDAQKYRLGWPDCGRLHFLTRSPLAGTTRRRLVFLSSKSWLKNPRGNIAMVWRALLRKVASEMPTAALSRHRSHGGAALGALQVVRPVLHHFRVAFKVQRVVVGCGDLVSRSVSELKLDPVVIPALLVQDGGWRGRENRRRSSGLHTPRAWQRSWTSTNRTWRSLQRKFGRIFPADREIMRG